MDRLRLSSDGTSELSYEDALYREIGRALTAWAVVEERLCNLLTAATGQSGILFHKSQWALPAGFFAVENFRSKLGMVDAACEVALPSLEGYAPKSGASLVLCWGQLKKRVEIASRNRNALAHLVVSRNPREPEESSRGYHLHRNYLDPATHDPKDKKSRKRYLSDVASYTTDFIELAHKLGKLCEVVGYASQQQRASLRQQIHPIAGAIQLEPAPLVCS